MEIYQVSVHKKYGGGGGFMKIRNVMYRIRVKKIKNLGEKQNVI